MMWASLLLAGILSGWWGALALAAAPPDNRNSFEETSTRTTRHHPALTSIAAAQKPADYRLSSFNLVTGINGRQGTATSDSQTSAYQRSAGSSTQELRVSKLARDSGQGATKFAEEFRRDVEEEGAPDGESLEEASTVELDARGPAYPNELPATWDGVFGHVPLDAEREMGRIDDLIREAFVSSSKTADRPDFDRHPKMDEFGLARVPRHSSTHTPFVYAIGTESSVERPRAVRSAKQRPKNRTKADSPREQRRRCRNKGCRGQNWCPDMDVGNRAYLAPTVFEGKARSMSSLRKPGSNYAVTFEVKQVYKSQPGFQPLQKNDSVRLQFRDKSAPGKSTVCSHDGDQGKQQQQQRDNQSGVVRANIKRGKVYLVFVNRVGPRNFTILGEPVIRSKKNEQAVQAVVRPDYGVIEAKDNRIPNNPPTSSPPPNDLSPPPGQREISQSRKGSDKAREREDGGGWWERARGGGEEALICRSGHFSSVGHVGAPRRECAAREAKPEGVKASVEGAQRRVVGRVTGAQKWRKGGARASQARPCDGPMKNHPAAAFRVALRETRDRCLAMAAPVSDKEFELRPLPADLSLPALSSCRYLVPWNARLSGDGGEAVIVEVRRPGMMRYRGVLLAFVLEFIGKRDAR
ncbi:hypothetical protein KM043_014292 [Ampulex compressa]|nr:hypothetical protein KM043_014292 [Ampulex compressa]